ncbi:phosphoribosylglycinamide formyltransferase-1 [Candidatus Kryptonium thompsonii]|uniref:Phosphoribosylglycinamide formyltransferase n=1 Tax=Candidatus Kryptonium thompsonii TaxID=1633631 RepID=A0A0P1LS80_9BACT|nr:phosphoribosylglycinamide formyltransferase [Candidatus Kryptonium thompsoni]CUS77489.1 phosphoribosylglycinamide formyltransferase-1 [Candidatus Kryptonium thompsoni]CUS79483.1 phosphoribosylglycinamide formyltransferase-1 [Candidatus Kryptonium thompsoni]CUS84639.1 phosphoribosylglycinamide formyltransferase-1 [Candidatus Kryptonium thompsoni]CUS89985.1 phosphoribosylglycinamide formyltransferase-1 [Candidatus Kryptonium thompsoni]CUS90043.1 phosphoribosylglycinamide formyltransferase-1 [
MNIAVFASGRGSNLMAILNAIKEGKLNARISVVISNNSNAGALEIARANGIDALHISRKQFSSDEDYVNRILCELKSRNIELIVLAGYMKKIPPEIIREYPNRILNIHPALLPAFGGLGMYGMNVHKAVIDYGVKITGVTVHIVDEEYDHGPIVMQRAVEVRDDDTPETLAERVLKVEHEIYPQAIKLFVEGKVKISGRKVIIKNEN